MTFTYYKDGLGRPVLYEDVVTDIATGQRIPKSVPADSTGTPLFGLDNPGRVAGTLTVKPQVGGTDISAANPLPAQPPAGSPVDLSLNKPTLNAGNLVREVAAGARFGFSIQNQADSQILVALDDGAGNALTTYVLAQADVAGGQGGAINSFQVGPHQGRIRVYGASSAQIAIRTW